ncbi:RHS repeat-associated core domain-containing protein [Riemerella anatipestifer]|uniref:RHS repeat-associated core domain-containing protein n=1 Tax=Riemerella anatipestifer TaxID=34085 RepID=UPI0030BF3F80
MTSLLDKKISRIGYNTLNLPNQVQSAAESLSYIYRADGVKVSQQRTMSNGFIRKDYIDGFHHETKEETMHIGNPVEPQEPILVGDSFETKPTPTPPSYGTQTSVTQRLLFFPTAEGDYDYLHKRYVYHYTDHLGNVRLSYYRSSNGNLTIDKESNYYPFGLEHTGYNGLLGNQSYNYKYNGKELQTEIGMYDYGARFYMPDLGRWGVVDPLAEKMRRHSPYNYVFNNPIMYIDPDGRRGTHINVRQNADGTHTVVGGEANNDRSIYIVNDNNDRIGVLGQMLTTHSFFDDGNNPVVGAVINTLDDSGNRFLQDEIMDNKDLGLIEYMLNAYGKQKYDFKARGIDERPEGMTEIQYRYRGSLFTESSMNGDTVLGTFASARDYGNVAAGYIAGRNGLPWSVARVGFDFLETIQNKGIPTAEGQSTQKAERVGHNVGIQEYNNSTAVQESIRRTKEDLQNPFNTPKF